MHLFHHPAWEVCSHGNPWPLPRAAAVFHLPVEDGGGHLEYAGPFVPARVDGVVLAPVPGPVLDLDPDRAVGLRHGWDDGDHPCERAAGQPAVAVGLEPVRVAVVGVAAEALQPQLPEQVQERVQESARELVAPVVPRAAEGEQPVIWA